MGTISWKGQFSLQICFTHHRQKKFTSIQTEMKIAFSCNYFYGNATNFRKDLDSLSIVDWLSETEKIPLNLDNITLSNIPHPQ